MGPWSEPAGLQNLAGALVVAPAPPVSKPARCSSHADLANCHKLQDQIKSMFATWQEQQEEEEQMKMQPMLLAPAPPASKPARKSSGMCCTSHRNAKHKRTNTQTTLIEPEEQRTTKCVMTGPALAASA